jgi:hypothetical protein
MWILARANSIQIEFLCVFTGSSRQMSEGYIKINLSVFICNLQIKLNLFAVILLAIYQESMYVNTYL